MALQIGYYFSAFTVDKPWMGRVRLQSMVSCWHCTLYGLACLVDVFTLPSAPLLFLRSHKAVMSASQQHMTST